MGRTRTSGLPRLEGHASTWLLHGGRPALGERHLAILEAVQRVGSLNAAAKRLGISYRDAWGKIRAAERLLGVELLTGRVGGRHGGGSRLTAVGEELLARLRAFHAEQRHAAARAADLFFGVPHALRHPGRGDRLLLATTTSAVDSGLLALLLPPFTRRTGIEVEARPVGSGAALRAARTGAVDAVLTHAPAAEAHAVAAGDVLNPRPVMVNDFVLVGPAGDPAGVRRAGDAGAALRRIADAHLTLLSRGDDSGTHQRERELLAAARVVARGPWYRLARAGMADVLRRASGAQAYALTDRGTFAVLAGTLSLVVLHAGDPELTNTYSILATNPHRHPGANYLGAMALIGWLTSPAAQELIAAYRVGWRPVVRPAGITAAPAASAPPRRAPA